MVAWFLNGRSSILVINTRHYQREKGRWISANFRKLIVNRMKAIIYLLPLANFYTMKEIAILPKNLQESMLKAQLSMLDITCD